MQNKWFHHWPKPTDWSWRENDNNAFIKGLRNALIFATILWVLLYIVFIWSYS